MPSGQRRTAVQGCGTAQELFLCRRRTYSVDFVADVTGLQGRQCLLARSHRSIDLARSMQRHHGRHFALMSVLQYRQATLKCSAIELTAIKGERHTHCDAKVPLLQTDRQTPWVLPYRQTDTRDTIQKIHGIHGSNSELHLLTMHRMQV